MVNPLTVAPLLKVANPPTCIPPVVIETAFECTVGKPVVVNAAPLTAKPPPAVSNPPTLKIPVSDAFPIVRLPIYALFVLIAVVEIPPFALTNPLAVNAATLVVPPVIVAPPPPVINPPTTKPLVIDSLATVRFAIYALLVLIAVVDKPPCKLVNPLTVAPLLKVANPPTCIPPVVIETAFECTVGKPVVVNAAPLTAKPPPAVSNPPTLKIPVSEAFPIVRDPMYALLVLIVVVEIPPFAVTNPLAVNAATLVVPPVIVAPPPPVINPPTTKPLVIDSLATVRFAIYALLVLIAVVDKPPCKLVNPLTVAPLLKVANPPTCIPPVVIETAFECTVGKPVVVNAAPLTAKPPPAVSNPPTLKIPVSDAFPIVRLPIYALFVLITVVEIPPFALTNPLAVNAATLVVPPVIVAPPPPVINPPTTKPLVIDSLATVRFAIYALLVLIVVVDIPLLAVIRPPTPRLPVLLKFPLFEILVKDPLLPDTTTPVNPDPSPVNLPVKLPKPAVVENVDM